MLTEYGRLLNINIFYKGGINMCNLVTIKSNIGESIQVADIKAELIEKIIALAPMCEKIDYIYLFGSSLEERCTDNSDIDIAIISSDTVNRLSSNKRFVKFMEAIYNLDFEQEYDRLYFSSVKEIEAKKQSVPICKELIQKGKIIYRRVV